MKICYDYEIFWKQKFSGVASRYYYNLIKHLSEKQNLKLKVFANLYLNERIENLPSDLLIGKRIKKRIPFTGKILEKFNSVYCNYQISKFNPDIIHKTYYSNKIIKKKSQIILTVFDLWHEKNSNFKSMPKKNSLEISDHIVCPSNKTKIDLIDIYNIDSKKVTVTYFGIENFDEFSNNKSQFKNSIDKPYILFVGTRGRYKNFINFIKAFILSNKIKKDFKILCFGGGPFTKEEKIFFYENKVTDLIEKTKNDDDYTLYNSYKNAKCLVYPSSHEGLGLPPLEAMSLKCPVIASNHDAILEAVGDAAVTFDPSSIDDILYKLENTIYSEEKISEITSKGIIQARNFSWKKCAAETLKVYSELS